MPDNPTVLTSTKGWRSEMPGDSTPEVFIAPDGTRYVQVDGRSKADIIRTWPDVPYFPDMMLKLEDDSPQVKRVKRERRIARRRANARSLRKQRKG